MSHPIIFIVGPTAVGKTEVTLALSKRIPLEVVSCDSMQVYKEMEVISCKPSRKLRKELPHHMVDVVSVKEDYSVADYARGARLAIKNILDGEARLPCVVGGSGLYMSVLLDGLFTQNAQDSEMREALKNEAQALGSQCLHDRLKKIDAAAAAKIHPNDTRRIIRALEVFQLTQKPISQWQKERSGLWGKFPIGIFCLNRQRPELYQRIDRRVEMMFERGLVKEVQGLLKYKLSKTAGGVIGIKEVKGYLDGEYALDAAKALVKQDTRRYAKRQLTWFRKDQRLQWLEIDIKEAAEETAEKILLTLEKKK